MNIILIIFYSLLDVILFRFINSIPVLGWSVIYKGRAYYPVYRLFQFLVFAGSLYLLYLYGNVYQIAGYILAFYLLTTDLLYYAFEWGWQGLLHLDEDKQQAYWLCNFWQAGLWLLPGKIFRFSRFMAVSITGLIILIISNFI